MQKLIAGILIFLVIGLFPSTVSAQWQWRPTISLWPQKGIVGGIVALRGTGFPQGKVWIFFDGGQQVASTITGNDGSFEASFKIPLISGGYKPVVAVAASGVTAKIYFTVEPQRLYVSTPRGTIGSSVAVWGSGFPPGNNIVLQLGDRVLTSLTSDANGYFWRMVNIPPTILPGWYLFEAVGAGVGAGAVFEVTQPIVALSSYWISSGDRVTVAILGGLPFAPVKVFIGDREITSSAALVRQDGSAELEVVIPPTLPWGGYSLKVRTGQLEGSQFVTVLAESPYGVARVLSSISNEVIRVLGYDRGQWKLYDPALLPELNTLKELEFGKAYWIQVKNDCVFVGANNVRQLSKGWNLIGW